MPLSLIRRTLQTLLVGATLVSSAVAGTNPKITVHPTARITEKLDVTKRVTLDKTHPALLVQNATDLGAVDTTKQLSHIFLILKSSDEQEYALRSLLDAQQDKGSPNYHQWVTPETFGQAFGVDPVDIATVKAWLQSAGITINDVAKGARVIDISGTVGQIQTAFGTSLHSYKSPNGETRIANASDITIPAAIAPVFGSIRLVEAKPKPQLAHPRTVKFDVGPGKPKFTGGDGNHYVGASDFATIYNTTPLLNAGTNGSGVKIALLGQSEILLSDIQTYRRMFNLPQNDPTFIPVGPDVGTSPGDDGESDLDVEVAGGAAPGAHIDFVYGGLTLLGAGIYSAAEYVINNNTDDIISLSYGECEYLEGSDNAFENAVWEQAAAQGQSVFVSTGDELVDSCDAGAPYAVDGYSVSGDASTPFNVAVGGTMFNEGTTFGATQYWSANNTSTYGTALSYIPEGPWNEGTFDPYGIYDPNTNPQGGFGGIVGGSSGISSLYLRPSWQMGTGVPAADPTLKAGSYNYSRPANPNVPHRLLPDVSLNAAADHDGTIYCTEGSCVLDDQGNVYDAGVVGGTSVSAPSMAGLQALINQALGGRQGLPNYYYYRVAAAQSTTTCDSDTYLTTAVGTAGASCGFHDVQTGNTYTPYTSTAAPPATSSNSIGFPTNPGYDLSVGLGSPDMAKLVAAWSHVTFNATTTTFSVTPTTGAHGATYTTNIVVAPVSSTVTTVPTGEVSIIANTTAGGGLGFYTLAAGSGTINGTLTGLPGGTYQVHAHYAGDVNFGASDSPAVTVTIGTETPTVALSSNLAGYSRGNFTLTPATTFAYGASIYLQGGVTPPSGQGVPTGNVIFNLKNGGTALPPLTTGLDPNGAYIPVTSNTFYAAGSSLFSGGAALDNFIPPNYPVLAPGVYTASLAYNGDNSFNSNTSSTITFTVGTGTPTVTVVASPTDITANATVALSATIAGATGGVIPTGTVTFTDTTTGAPVSALGSCTLDATGFCSVTTTAISKTGANTISAAFVPSGANSSYYSTPTAKTTTVTVTTGTAPTVTLALSGPIQVLATETITLTVPATTGNTTVYFYDNGKPLSTAATTVRANATTATLTVATFTAGNHVITATWSGNATTPGSTSAPQTLVVSQNTPYLTLTGASQVINGNQVSLSAVFVPQPYNPVYNNNTGLYNAANPAPVLPVTFYAGNTVIGTAPLVYFPASASYIAQYTGPAPGLGTTVYTAQYLTGDPNYAATTSNTNTTTVYTQGFSLTAQPSSLSIPQGQAGLSNITVTDTGKWSGTLTFTCIGAPLYATCALGSPTLFFSGSTFLSTQNEAVSIITVAPQPTLGGFMWIPAVFLAGFLLVRRKQLSTGLRQSLTLAVIFCGMVSLSGCGKGFTRTGIQTGTPMGTYPITVTATGVGTNGSANITQSVTLTATVISPQ